jgi:hypothetical protein
LSNATKRGVNRRHDIGRFTRTKTVRVISFDQVESLGGFWWFPAKTSDAVMNENFDDEVKQWEGDGDTTTVRWVDMLVPAKLDTEGLIDWIEQYSDYIEFQSVAIREVTV